MKILITGSSGLIGSEVCSYFSKLGWSIHGVDNNQRSVFFGPQGDTTWRLRELKDTLLEFTHHEIDIRDRSKVLNLLQEVKPDAIVHTAAQPSHDKAASIPFDDFDVNAVGTLNLLEATRLSCKDSPFVHMSTNKVYGDGPNQIKLKELVLVGTSTTQFCKRYPRILLHRSMQALSFWSIKSSCRYNGSGIWQLLWHGNMLPSRWLPYGTITLRSRATWIP